MSIERLLLYAGLMCLCCFHGCPLSIEGVIRKRVLIQFGNYVCSTDGGKRRNPEGLSKTVLTADLAASDVADCKRRKYWKSNRPCEERVHCFIHGVVCSWVMNCMGSQISGDAGET